MLAILSSVRGLSCPDEALVLLELYALTSELLASPPTLGCNLRRWRQNQPLPLTVACHTIDPWISWCIHELAWISMETHVYICICINAHIIFVYILFVYFVWDYGWVSEWSWGSGSAGEVGAGAEVHTGWAAK